MKTTLMVIGVILSLMMIPLGFLARFLLYKHVQAPPELWLLFWIDVPLAILGNVVSQMMQRAK